MNKGLNKQAWVKVLLGDHFGKPAQHKSAQAFAPTNIALVKYWGKRDSDLNLPMTGSLSIALPTKGAWTTLSVLPNSKSERITLNGKVMGNQTAFASKISRFLDLFRPSPTDSYTVDTVMNIPVAAGVASSACGFAALTLAADALYGWGLSSQALSMLARLGSGSACRSLWRGWVEWKPGILTDGADSFAAPYPVHADWSDLRIGLLLCDTQPKPCSSREAMQRSVETSPLYAAWPKQVAADLSALKEALASKDFEALGQIAERNAEAMHACMRAAVPSIDYATQETLAAKAQVRALRDKGISVFYTQDAGPNLKLLFLESEEKTIKAAFPKIEIEAVMPAKAGIQEQVVLVDEQDQVVGTAEKLAAHQTGQLHRAFSVFLYRRTDKGVIEWLLQQRSPDKYHCGGLWTNSCCSHPRPGESIMAAAQRRLWEELRLKAVLQQVSHFIYRATFDNGLIEHEFDHVLIGECAVDTIQFNPLEIQSCRWVQTNAVLMEYKQHPERFTPWFMKAFRHILGSIVLKQELNVC